jgi:beta-lactamase superfamily II metal-dependent hydrolase
VIAFLGLLVHSAFATDPSEDMHLDGGAEDMQSDGKFHPHERTGPRIQARGLLALIILVGVMAAWAPFAWAIAGNGKLQIHHIDVGQGDAALIVSPLGQVVLVDTGPYDNCTPFLNYASGLGVTSIDYHFASHYHADHIGCLDELLSGGVTLNIAGYDRGYSYTTATYTTYVNTVGAKRQTLTKNQIVTLDAGSAHPVYIKCVDLNGAGVYSPTGSDENAKSVTLKVSYGDFDEVLGGDLTASPSVEPTVGPEVGDVEVYKVHHHGSASSTYDAWLTATTPEVGVISVGDGNSYGHPTSNALTRLHNHNVKTYWTETGAGATPAQGWDKVGGTIVIEADYRPGAEYTVTGTGFVDTYYNSGSADLTPPVVSVTVPAGAEVLYVGTAADVDWVATDNVNVDSISIYYSTDGGATFPYTIATSEQNDSTYSWTVPNTPSSNCVVKIVAYDSWLNSGEGTSEAPFSIQSELGTEVVPAAAQLELLQNVPNPFNPVTNIEFSLAQPGRVLLRIYSVTGGLVKTLVDDTEIAGKHSAVWTGEDEHGTPVASGVYTYVLETSGQQLMRKLVVLR